MIGDYQSFFNPIPIDFLQEQLRGRQAGYDTAFAGALADKDAMAQQQVGMADIASKNQIINDSMSNIDKTVEEQFGGDWGRAAKTVARQVSELRANPFWNAQKEVEKKRQAFEEQVTKFGPKAMIFGQDPRQLTTMDEQGQVRGVDQFTGRVVEQGDWGKTARDIFSSLTPDQYKRYNISPEEFEGFITGTKVTQVTRTKIEEMAKDPAIQLAFQQSHPEFVEGFSSLDPTQKEKFGLKGDTLAEATRQTLLGNIAPSVFRQQDMSLEVNPYQIADFKKSLEGEVVNPYFGSANYQPVLSTEANGRLEKHKAMLREPGAGGTGAPTAGGPLGSTPVFYDNMTAQQRENERQRALGVREKYLNDYYNVLGSEYPELKNLTRDEAFKAYENYLQNASESARLTWNTRLEDSSSNLKIQAFSNINSGDFTVQGIETTGDVFGKKGVADQLGYNTYQDLEEAMADKKLDTRINVTEGTISMTIPAKEGKKGAKPVTINFSPDVQTQDMLESAQFVTESYYNPTSIAPGEMRPVDILDYKGEPTGQQVYVEGEGSIINGNKKQIILIDHNTRTRQPISLEQYQEMVAGAVDTRFNNYEGLSGNPGKIQ
jgi:hypothetical protein